MKMDNNRNHVHRRSLSNRYISRTSLNAGTFTKVFKLLQQRHFCVFTSRCGSNEKYLSPSGIEPLAV